MSRTIATLTAVVALTLAACGSGTSDTTTTEDTRGWSDEAFRDVMAYCQAADSPGSCASIVTSSRDGGKCSVEAVYRLVDLFNGKQFIKILPTGEIIGPGDTPQEELNNLLRYELHPAGDCLEYSIRDE